MEPTGRRGVTRRSFLGAVGAAGAAGAVAGVGTFMGMDAGRSEFPKPASAQIPFFGLHQAGIGTPIQDRLAFGAFDVTAGRIEDVRELMREWTEAASRMCRGLSVSEGAEPPNAPPSDTGEARGLPPARLRVTFGFGPTLFQQGGTDRFSLAARRPEALVEIPHMPGDELDHSRSGGDISIQACSDDPQVAFHAIRNLARIGRGAVALRWSQLGFGRTSSSGNSDVTPRNLQGFKDGTNNLSIDDARMMAQHVWVRSGQQPAWMRGGSYQVVRRIRMRIEAWDRASLEEQERTIGRRKRSGSPLGRAGEFDIVPLQATGANGQLLVPIDAHIRLASPSEVGGHRILRRGYSFADGMDPTTGELDAGLFFICYQRDPRTGFIPIQQLLAGSDALNEYIVHTGGGIFAIPPGTRPDGWIGEALLS